MLGNSGLMRLGVGGSSPVFSGDVTANSFTATAGSGSNGLVLSVAGARLKLSSGGTGDYLTSDGSSTISTPGALKAAGLIGAVPNNSQNLSLRNTSDSTVWSMIVNTSGQSLLTIYNNSTQQILQYQNSGEVKVCVGTPAALSTLANVAATVSANSTSVGNVGASGPDDLITYTLPANALTTAGRGIRVKAWGTTANNANAKTVRLVFGGTTLVTKQLTASVAGTWNIEATILRTGASAQKFYAAAENDNGTTVSSTDGATVLRIASANTCAETESGTIVIKGQSTVSTADNDIVQQALIVEYI